MRIRGRRHLSGTLLWALSLEALVFGGGMAAIALGVAAGRIAVAFLVITLLAAACGIAFDWRIHDARAHALRDPLTGLPNRVLLDDRIEQALHRSRRTDEPFAVIVIDLDGFKDVNDVRGHRAGDVVLRTLARRFEAIMRSSDTVARVGGDEFVVLAARTVDDPSVVWLLAALAAAAFLFVFVLVYPAGIGMGDVKLALLMGAALGSSVAVALFVGFAASFVPAVVLLARHGRAALKQGIPLGPFLALGSVVALFAGGAILGWYTSY